MSCIARASGALLATASLVLAAPSADAAPVAIPLQCRAKVGPAFKKIDDLKAELDVRAPATVVRGATFQERLTVKPLAVPTRVQGIAVNDVHALSARFRVGAGATVVKASLAGAGATVAQAKGIVTVTAAGPFRGGSTIRLADLVLDLKATGRVGSTIETLVGGTSYTNPAVAARFSVTKGHRIDVPASCFAATKLRHLAGVKVTGAKK
ncbi:MAG: cyclase [Acidimicrobiales bacterium]|nr:cyclase [Acidimicrobiales bacterium]